jgi:hypothetical protein
VISLLLASTLAGLSPSDAVLKAYDMACNKGELHLDASEAKVVSPDSSATPFPLYLEGTPEKLTTIYLNYPKDTVISIATYNPKFPQQMRTVCAVSSRSISPKDAVAAFLSGVQKGDVSSDLNPARVSPLEIDRPKEGYKKTLLFLDHSVIIETGLYKAPH